MRTALLLISLLLSGFLLMAAGCTEEAIAIEATDTATPQATTTPGSATPSVSKYLSASVVDLQKHYTSPPYWELTIRVDNRGPIDAYEVVTLVQLIDAEDGTPGPSKTQTFERITEGDHKTYTFKLYVEDDRAYTAEVEILSTQEER
jgi:hypothetical protein